MLRRALGSVGASASAISCAALAGQSRAAQAAGAEEAPKYGFEGHKVNYGGAGDVKPSNREKTKRIVSHMSTVPNTTLILSYLSYLSLTTRFTYK